jgi:membrane fusion protein (multidrug efflux system)
MAKRILFTVLIAAVLIAALGYFKVRQVQAAIKANTFTPPPEAVTTLVAKQESWPTSLTVVGTMAAIHGVTVSADLPGTVSSISFESGRSVQQGQVLVELDTSQEKAQLASLEAQRDLAKINYARMKQLVDEGVISRLDYDKATADQKATEANVAEIKATIQRKTIRAPFSGQLGIRQVNLGQYLASGGPIVPLQSVDPIYVNFGVPQQVLANLKVGQQVKLATNDLGGMSFTGKVNAIDSVVDPATRNVQLQATVSNPGGKLRPGMFVQVDVGVGANRQVVSLPASAINYAPFGDSVFVLEDMKGPDGKTYRGVRQQFVKVDGTRGDQVGVVSGIKPGEEIVTSGVFKLRNGAAVAVNNAVQPGNDPAPKPEDN